VDAGSRQYVYCPPHAKTKTEEGRGRKCKESMKGNRLTEETHQTRHKKLTCQKRNPHNAKKKQKKKENPQKCHEIKPLAKNKANPPSLST
jgi:hypothetical protein